MSSTTPLPRRRLRRTRAATALAAAGALIMSAGVIGLVASPAVADNHEPCTPRAAYTQTTLWVTASPGAGWYKIDEKKVVDKAAVGATEGHWENLDWYVWKGGPRAEAPGLDEVGWNDPPALPNGLPHEPTPETVYNVSQSDAGLGSWFKYDGDWIPGTPAQAEVSHQEYRFAFDHPAVTCDDPPPVNLDELSPAVTFTDPDCDNLEGADWDGNLEALLDYEVDGDVGPGETVVIEAAIEPGLTGEYEFADDAETEFTHTFDDITLADCVAGEETVIPKPKPEPKPDKKPTVKGVQVVAPPAAAPAAAAPTAVAAGLGDTATASPIQTIAQMLVAGGMLLLMAGAWIGLGRREFGTHEA